MRHMTQNVDFILELLQENGMVTDSQVAEGWKKVADAENENKQLNIIDALQELGYLNEEELL